MLVEIILGLGISYFVLFVISIILKDNSIVDVFWGLGFLQIAIHSLIISKFATLTQLLLFSIILAWSLRISFYIFSKKIKRKKEDKRYAVWRKTWKHFYLRSFFQVYVLQCLLFLVVAVPIILFNLNPLVELNLIFLLGIFVALIGLIYETIADFQLKKFVNVKARGTIMEKGLWKYSRHPNYFGESVFWLGISIIGSTVSFYSFLSFLTITFLLRFVSGVPMAEKGYLSNKNFLKYMKKTNPMFPNFFIKD